MWEITYSENSTGYKENWDLTDPYFPVTMTPDNLWLMTENDNYLVTETGDYLVIY
jgi:hypothetical protein